MSQTGLARDNSIASLSGASQQALALNGNRQFLAIENPVGNATVGVNVTGGAATLGGVGTLTLLPGGSLIFDRWVPQNAVFVIGTATQTLTVIEG
jgi:hypothetical protein